MAAISGTRILRSVLLATAVAGAACSGSIAADAPGLPGPGNPGPNNPATGKPGPTTPSGDPTPSTNPPPATSTDSASLFTCSDKPAASAPRIWRLSAVQFERTVRSLAAGFEKESMSNPFSGATSDSRFPNYADGFGLPVPIFDRVSNSTEQLSARLVTLLAAEQPCVANPDAACVRSAIGKIGARAFRRPLTTEEHDRYARFVESLRASAGPFEALRSGFQVILSSPNFLFRLELGEDKVDATGRKRLTPFEAASALAYTLTDGPPDAALMTAAAEGKLANAADLRVHVARLIGDPTTNPAVHRFFREYFKHAGVEAVFKDAKDFPKHKPAALLADTDMFIKEVVKGGKDVLSTLLSADWGFVGPETATNYNLESMAPKAQQRVTMPAGQRAGILTQPAFLTAFSDSEHNNTIGRGHFIASSLLCVPLPATPPDNVPALPELPNATMREKLEVHRTSSAACRACHDIMDGLGLGLEMYDHTGRYRTMEGTKPADGRGNIVGTNSSLDGPFNGAIELGMKLAKAPQVEQCFVRHQFRYLFGRDETKLDACSLNTAFETFKNTGGNVAETVTALLSSDSFLYRIAR